MPMKCEGSWQKKAGGVEMALTHGGKVRLIGSWRDMLVGGILGYRKVAAEF